jgi:hypothetical protein
MKFWALHPDWQDGPQWRRCEMKVFSAGQSSTYAHFKVRRLSGGAKIPDLFDSLGFRACLDRIFEDILRDALPGRLPGYRSYYLVNARSKGAGEPPNGSPHISFTLSNELSTLLDTISNHEQIALTASARKIAARQDRHRAAFRPSA